LLNDAQVERCRWNDAFRCAPLLPGVGRSGM